MDEKHQTLAEQIFSQFSFALTEKGNIDPLYIMIMQDGNAIPIVIQSNNNVTMEMYINAAANAAHEMGATAMFFVCEQMMINKKKDDPEVQALLDGKIRASQHPDAEDYLTLIYMTAEGDCESLIAKIHRDPMGTKYTNEKEWIDGSITNILIPWKESK